jgi:aconitase B
MTADVYRYLNFDQLAEYREVADKAMSSTAA